MRYLVLCLLALTACAPAKPVRVNLNQLVTRAQLDQVQTPLMAAWLTGPGTLATMVPVGVNGTVVTWRSVDDVSLSMQQGIMVATRGLGQDLMAADVSDTLRMIRGKTGEYTRVHSYLDGEYQTQLQAFTCRQESRTPVRIDIIDHIHNTHRIEESCFAQDQLIANTYWVDAGGTVWKSKQWVSPALGYMETELLVR